MTGEGHREAVASRHARAGDATRPQALAPAADVLLRDAVRASPELRDQGRPGDYRVVLVDLDRVSETRRCARERTAAGCLPDGPWSVSALIVRSPRSTSCCQAGRKPVARVRPAPPASRHMAARQTLTPRAGAAGGYQRRAGPAPAPSAVNQLARFKTLEAPSSMPSSPSGLRCHAGRRPDVLLEVLHEGGGGWFHPDRMRRHPITCDRALTSIEAPDTSGALRGGAYGRRRRRHKVVRSDRRRHGRVGLSDKSARATPPRRALRGRRRDLLFGFSRGAYTARSGRPDPQLRHPQERTRAGPRGVPDLPDPRRRRDGEQAKAFRRVFSRRAALRSVPGRVEHGRRARHARCSVRLFNRRLRLHDGKLSSIVKNAFQALASTSNGASTGDGRRTTRAADQRIDQAWFPGAHS